MFIRKLKNRFYKYESRRIKDVVVTTYLGRATEEEVKRWQESRRKK
jgi:hypothetical protein